jgi:hydroxymethylpyrimidine/phosphomethylpyrimidine kinase
MTVPRILTIAGSDSGGGAGIQADIKTITLLGGHAMTAVTAITAQNTLAVQRVAPVPPDLVIAQIDAVIADIGVDAIKIGMLGSAAVAEAVAERLADVDVPIVLDPVIVASSGRRLADAATITAMQRLIGLATIVTPNLPEWEALGGPNGGLGGCGLILIKGGHGEGDEVVDRLIGPDGEIARWSAARIATRHAHGTGCTLSSAIATGLGAHLPIEQAIDKARQFVRSALLAAPGLGQGHGPMGYRRS